MRKTAMLSTFAGLALANLTYSNVAFGEAILRTAACSTLSQVSYNGRDYTIRNYALRHNLEWKNPNEELDLQLHEQLSDTFPPLATVVRDLVRAAKGEDGRELSGSENAQVLGVYGTNPGPVVFPARDYSYEWTSSDSGIRTDEVQGKVVGRYRVTKRKISDEVELIRQVLVKAPDSRGGIAPRSEETSCFRFKQPRWMWSQLVPAPLETAAAAFDPLVYAVDNAWNQLKECRAAKGSCESLDKTYLSAVEARDKAWKDNSIIQQLRDVGRKPGARGFAFTRFPEDVQVDEQGWLVLDQGSGYLDHLGEKTNGENLRPPSEAMQQVLEQQRLLVADAGQARAQPSAAKPRGNQPAVSEARSSVPRSVETQVARSQAEPETQVARNPAEPETQVARAPAEAEAQVARSPAEPETQVTRAPAEPAMPAKPKLSSAGPSEPKIAAHRLRGRPAMAHVQRVARAQPTPRVPAMARMQPRIHPPSRMARAAEEDFGPWMMPGRPWPPLQPPPPRYEVRIRRDVSPFYFLFED